MRGNRLLPMLMLVIASCIGESTEQHQEGSRNGKIAFLKIEQLGSVPYDVREGVYLVGPNGGRAQELLGGPEAALHGRPTWSPDGTKLAFVRLDSRFGPSKLLVVGANGGGLSSILSCPGTSCVWNPTWSPDGESFAFVRGLNIYAMAAAGGEAEQLTDCAPDGSCYLIGGLSWSPDGEQIAFAREDRRGMGAIYVMSADGGDVHKLTECRSRLCIRGERDAEPAWSPDGAKILFVRERNVWIMGNDGSGVRRLTDCSQMGCAATSPAWSPDGAKILFVQAGSIYVMNSDGSVPHELVEGLAPAWQPLQKAG